jgi:hypothetical protein
MKRIRLEAKALRSVNGLRCFRSIRGMRMSVALRRSRGTKRTG